MRKNIIEEKEKRFLPRFYSYRIEGETIRAGVYNWFPYYAVEDIERAFSSDRKKTVCPKEDIYVLENSDTKVIHHFQCLRLVESCRSKKAEMLKDYISHNIEDDLRKKFEYELLFREVHSRSPEQFSGALMKWFLKRKEISNIKSYQSDLLPLLIKHKDLSKTLVEVYRGMGFSLAEKEIEEARCWSDILKELRLKNECHKNRAKELLLEHGSFKYGLQVDMN